MLNQEQIKKIINDALEKSLFLFRENRLEEAEIVLKQTIKADPENANAHGLLGLIYYSIKNYEKAIEFLEQTLKLDPNNVEAHNNISLAYSCVGDFDKSLHHIEKTIELMPSNYFHYNNYALQLRHIGRLEEAIKNFKISLEIKEDAKTWSMLGGVYGELKDLQTAESCFIKSIELDPNFSDSHVNLAYVYHLRGEWEKSWQEYEYRFQSFSQAKFFLQLYNDFSKKWHGQPIENKRIILYCEQGLGDVIHFSRYLPYVGKNYIVLHCPKELNELMEPFVNETININVIDNETITPFHDYHASLLSLPYLLKLKEIPKPLDFKVDEKFDLSSYNGFYKIGISWAGSPQHPNDIFRSCYLKMFKPICDLPNVKLFGLQKDLRKRIHTVNLKEEIDFSEECEGMKIVDLSGYMNNFVDTASIINSLDLIITVDTALLHLAGSLGKKTYALIAWNPDWRWKLEGITTEWYDSVRLFRQKIKNSWEEVFNEIKENILQNQ